MTRYDNMYGVREAVALLADELRLGGRVAPRAAGFRLQASGVRL